MADNKMRALRTHTRGAGVVKKGDTFDATPEEMRTLYGREKNRLAEPVSVRGARRTTAEGDVPEDTDTDELEGVEFASPAARQAAIAAKLTADSFKRKRRSNEAGFTKADVERIAGASADEDEE